MPLFCDYLSEEQLKGFDNYKYSSVDTSPVAVYISHPFWNQVVKLVPRWVAPNVLTFSGFVLVMLGFGLISYYDYYLLAASDELQMFNPIPNWVWLVLCLFTFSAHVLDGIDGKQARKIGASGPTGELFDHGIDSWLTIPFIVCFFSVFGRGEFGVSALRLAMVLMSMQLVFVVSHWEKYNTGVLFLPWGYDVGQYFLSAFYLLTFLNGGHTFWKFTVLNIAPVQVAELCFYFGCFGLSVPMSLYNLYKSYATKTGYMRSFYEAMLPLFSTVVLFSVAIIWGIYSPYDVLNKDPRVFMWTFGTVFSNIACRLIIAQMTTTRCNVVNWLLYPYVGLSVVSMLTALGLWELYLLRILAVFVTLAHIHYATSIVRQMCGHFCINCFTVKKNSDYAYGVLPTNSAAENEDESIEKTGAS